MRETHRIRQSSADEGGTELFDNRKGVSCFGMGREEIP
jgi:hypothetical protein